MAPPSQEGRVFNFLLSPSQLRGLASFEQRGHIETPNVTKATVFSMTTCHYVHFIADSTGRVESPRTRLGEILVELDLPPVVGLEVEVPGIIQVTHPLATEHHEVRVFQLRDMVSSLPRPYLVFLGPDLNPVLSVPVENTD